MAYEKGGFGGDGHLNDSKVDAVLMRGERAFEVSFGSDGAGGACVGAAHEGQTGFDGAESRVEEVLLGSRGWSKPRVVGEVDEDLSALSGR